MDPDYQEAFSDTAYYDSTNDMNFLRDCLNKATVGENGESTRERTKRSLRAKLLRMISDVEVCEDEDVLRQLEKSINSSRSLFTSMMQQKGYDKYTVGCCTCVCTADAKAEQTSPKVGYLSTKLY